MDLPLMLPDDAPRRTACPRAVQAYKGGKTYEQLRQLDGLDQS